jgi:hypothetical protein
MQAAIQTRDSVVRNWRICTILASALAFSGLAAAPAWADDAPPNLTRLIAARETETAQAQSNYTYRQTVTLDELNPQGLASGSYREFATSSFRPSTSAPSGWWANRSSR